MQKTDITIIGGGIAGLWLLNVLISRGYSVVLLEKNALGAGQTSASQGMIHGGIKYALHGLLSDASETIAAMPARWQACLEGHGTLDLTTVKTLSQDYFLFSDASLTSRITAFLGSKAIEGRVESVEAAGMPAALKDREFKGLVYRLQDFVIDTLSLVEELSQPYHDRIYTGEFDLEMSEGEINAIRLADGANLSAQQYVLAAGSGNGELIHRLGLPVEMQLRPLKQVIVTGPQLPELYAHAVNLKTGDKPSLTITTHYLDDNTACWYLGGQLAETGVRRSNQAQIKQAQQELNSLLPWVDFSRCSFRTYSIDRAEPSQQDQKRPDRPYAKKFGNSVVCWPTKLTLTPLLGDMVISRLDFEPSAEAGIEFGGPVHLASSPWALKNS